MKEWQQIAVGVAITVFIGFLGWGGTTLVGLSTDVAALDATQKQLIRTIDRTLDALDRNQGQPGTGI